MRCFTARMFRRQYPRQETADITTLGDVAITKSKTYHQLVDDICGVRHGEVSLE